MVRSSLVLVHFRGFVSSAARSGSKHNLSILEVMWECTSSLRQQPLSAAKLEFYYQVGPNDVFVPKLNLRPLACLRTAWLLLHACNTQIWNSRVPCRDSGSILLAVVLYLNILSLVLTGLTARSHNSLGLTTILCFLRDLRLDFYLIIQCQKRQPLHWCPPLGREPFLTLLRISYMLSSGGHYLQCNLP